MQINVPTNIQFEIPERKVQHHEWEKSGPMKVCFKHAVLQATIGDYINTELIEDRPRCYICEGGDF